MKIHGIVWIIVGGFILGASYFTGLNTDIQKFTLFIWAGWAFVAWGVFKTVIWILKMPKKAKPAKENFPHHRHGHAEHEHQGNQNSQFIKFCSNCGNAVRHFDNFCYKCGNRMFHHK